MEKTETTREYQKALHYLYAQMQTGDLAIGDRLPTERALAETLSISRNSTREAIRMLEHAGLIESRRGSGNYLTGNAAQSISGLVEIMLLLHQTNRAEICSFRRNMEKAVCRTILEAHTLPRWNGKLTHILFQLDQAETQTEHIHWDQQFHDTLLQATENRFWILMLHAVTEVYHQWIAAAIFHADPEVEKLLRLSHRELLCALEQRDFDACCKAIDRHYDLADQELLSD